MNFHELFKFIPKGTKLEQYLRVMKLVTFLLTCCLLNLSAAGYAQRINLHSNGTIPTILQQLRAQSGYDFFYDSDLFKNAKPVNIHIQNASLEQALRKCFEKLPYSFTIEDHIVVIRENQAVTTALQRQNIGRLSGRITDSRGDALPGASLKILQSGKGIQSSADGYYQFSLQPGTYSLEISSISFQTRKIENIVIKAGELTPLDVVMQEARTALKEVTISADYKKASVEGLYLRQKNNAALTDGISAEQIARTPDKNIGEVLKRISGLSTVDNKYIVVRGLSERYNQAVLNGQVMPSTELNRKNFSFDIIPANLVDNVTVYKTLTPDKSAEFGGGSVEINTLDIPSKNFFDISLGATYYDKATGKDFLTTPLDGREYLGSINPGRKLFGSLDWLGSKDIEDQYNSSGKNPALFSNTWGINRFKAPLSPNFRFSAGRTYNLPENDAQFGTVASISYRNTLQTQDVLIGREGYAPFLDDGLHENNSLNGKIYGFQTNLGALFGLGFRNQRQRISFQTLYTRSLDQRLILGSGISRDAIGSPALSYFDLSTQMNLWQNQLKGEYNSGKPGIKLNWMLSYLTLDRQKPDNKNLYANYIHTNENQPNEYSINTPGANGASTGALRSWSRAFEKNLTWDLSATLPFKFSLANILAENNLKMGYGGWYKDRAFYVLNTSSHTSIAENYTPIAQVFSKENLTSVDISRFGDGYHRNAQLHSFFGMLDNRIAEKWRLVWGIRAEYYNLNKVNANLEKRQTDLGNTLDLSALYTREPNLRWFPSASLTYSLNPSMNFRLAYSKSIIRPDLREISFFKQYDFELGGDYIGNYIISTLLHNYDFRYEWFPAPGEIISASVFYKKIKYPMEITRDPGSNTFDLINNKEARNYGFEIEARKSLAFTQLPLLKNITLYGNFTAMKASVIPMKLDIHVAEDRKKVVADENLLPEQKRAQQGASNFVVNAGFYYDTKLFSLSLSYNYTSHRIQQFTADIKNSLWEKPPTSLDGQLTFHLLKEKLDAKINISNLLNSSTIYYLNQTPEGLASDQLSIRELGYQKKDDIWYRTIAGRSYGLSLNYRF